MSNEVKIAILAIAAIALSFWGYKFILGKNLLIKSNIFYVEYPQVDELMLGTSVTINGVKIGSVESVTLSREDYRGVLVGLDLEKGIRIPQNTLAILAPKGFMGGKVVKLVFDRPCSGPDCAKAGDYLEGRQWGMVEAMLGEDGFKPYVDTLVLGLNEVFDTINAALLGKESNSPIAQGVKSLNSTLENLKSASFQLDVVVRQSSGKIDGTLSNLYSLTGSLEKKSGEIGSIIDNTSSLTGQLAESDIKQMMKEVNASIIALKTTLQETEKTMAGLNGIVTSISNKEGTLGKLIYEDDLYESLNSLSYGMDTLVTDLQVRPYRYIPLKSRKKVKKFDRLDAKR